MQKFIGKWIPQDKAHRTAMWRHIWDILIRLLGVLVVSPCGPRVYKRIWMWLAWRKHSVGQLSKAYIFGSNIKGSISTRYVGERLWEVVVFSCVDSAQRRILSSYWTYIGCMGVLWPCLRCLLYLPYDGRTLCSLWPYASRTPAVSKACIQVYKPVRSRTQVIYWRYIGFIVYLEYSRFIQAARWP